MAITGSLAADFSSYNAAVDGAVTKLKSFESGSGKVESQLNRMTDAFSGRRIISEATLMVSAVDRIGGTAMLTAAELDRVSAKATEAVAKMKALGIDVPPGLQKIASETTKIAGAQDAMLGSLKSIAGAFGIAFSVGAVVNYGRSLLTAADHLVTLSARTGLTIEEVQKLSGVAAASGNTIDELSGATNKLTLSLNDPKAQASLRSLGINLDALKSASPYEQLRMIAGAISDVVSPSEQAEHAVALFGKSGMSILPTLRAEFDKLAGNVTVASAEQVRALADADAALKRAQANAANWATSYVGSFAMIGEKYGWLKAIMATAVPGLAWLTGSSANAFNEMAAEAAKAAAEVGKIPPALDPGPLLSYDDRLRALRDSFDDLSYSQKATIKEALALNESTSTIAANMNLTEAAVSVYAESLKTAAAEAKKLAETQEKTLAKSLLELAKLQADYTVTQSERSGTANEQEIARINATFEVMKASMVKADIFSGEAAAAHARNWKQALDGVGVDFKRVTGDSIAAMQEQADNALKTYNAMVASGGFHREELEKQVEKYRELQAAASGFGQAAVAAQEAAGQAAAKTTSDLIKMAEDAWNKGKAAREKPLQLNKVNERDARQLTEEQQQQIENYQKGKVLVGFGPIQAYWDEIRRMTANFIAQNKRLEQQQKIAEAAAAKLASAPVLSSSTSGGGARAGGGAVAVTNTFHIVDTEANIVRRVSDAITRSVLQGQKLRAAG